MTKAFAMGGSINIITSRTCKARESRGDVMTAVEKLRQAIEQTESLIKLLFDISSPLHVSLFHWEELTDTDLNALVRLLNKELAGREQSLLVDYARSNAGLPRIDADEPEEKECTDD
jgi:hypothetical protein